MDNIWNKRFKNRGWEITRAHSQALKNGYCIEALILSMNKLKAIMFVVLENEYRKAGVSEKVIEKRLNRKKDVNDLLSLMRDSKILTVPEVE